MELQGSKQYSSQVPCPILIIVYQAKIQVCQSESFNQYHKG